MDLCAIALKSCLTLVKMKKWGGEKIQLGSSRLTHCEFTISSVYVEYGFFRFQKKKFDFEHVLGKSLIPKPKQNYKIND